MGLMIDKYGLVRAGTDGGDSLQRTYSVLLLTDVLARNNMIGSPAFNNALNVKPANAENLLEPQPGLYIRSPDPDWTSDLRVASRDQLTPVICYLAYMASSPVKDVSTFYRSKLSNLLTACWKRKMLAQNTIKNGVEDVNTAETKMADIITPDLWSVFASGYMKTRYSPLALLVMLVGDVFGVLGALFKVFAPINKDGTMQFRMPGPGDVDDTNANNVHIARQYNFATPLSWLARKIYMLRRKNYGNTEMGEKDSVMGALAWYNRDDNTDITELYRPLVEKY